MQTGNKRLESASLDEIAEGSNFSKVDFIKVDVEGAESEVLQGAERTIRRFSPRLSLALYHDPAQERSVTDLFRNRHPNYRFSYKHLVRGLPYILFCEPAAKQGRVSTNGN
jgi:hypothetical protein